MLKIGQTMTPRSYGPRKSTTPRCQNKRSIRLPSAQAAHGGFAAVEVHEPGEHQHRERAEEGPRRLAEVYAEGGTTVEAERQLERPTPEVHRPARLQRT